MEAPPSESYVQDDVNRIVREIKNDAEKILSVPNSVQNPYTIAAYQTDSDGVISADQRIIDPQTPFSDACSPFGAYPQLPSVTSPLSAVSIASPVSVPDCYSTPADTAVLASAEMSNGWLPSPGPAAVTGCTAQLVITEQPVERCRFRYRAEHSPHGALRGADRRQKSCPKVKVENFKGRGYVLASLYTNEQIPRPHINELWGWSNNCVGGRCRVELDANMCAVFSNMGIMRQKENDVAELLYQKYLQEFNEQGMPITEDAKENLRERAQRETATMKDCLHCVRLGFQAFLIDETTGSEFTTPIILSSAVCNSQNTGYSELKIAEIDKSCGHAIGGDRIWLRCAAKIRRDQIKVIFHEPNTRWEAEGVFSASDVFEQILIIFKTPAYHDVNITERVHVNLHLLRTSDNTYSPAVDFIYLPADDGPAAKRPRRAVPAFGPSGFGYFPDQSPPFGGSSQSQSFQPSAEFDAYTPGGTGVTRQHGRIPAAAAQHGPFASRASLELDSGLGLDPGSLTSQPGSSNDEKMHPISSLTDVRSRIEKLSLAELNRIGAAGEAGKLQSHLTGLWETYLRALWSFSAEGDPTTFVSACKGLIGLQDEYGNTAIHTAVKNKQSFALKTMLNVLESMPNKQEIIDQRNLKKQTALHLAIRFGDDDCVHYLTTAGADRSAVDADGQSVAHYLAETFNEDIYRDILSPPSESPTAKQKAELTFVNDDGLTAVHSAVKRKKLALLESLLEAGASVNDLERNTGKSALHLAAEVNDVDAVELLLQNHIRMDIQAYDGTTALQVAAKLRSAPIVAKLMAAGADPNEKSSSMAAIDDKKATAEDGAGSEAEECSEVLEGEGTTLHSAFDFAGDDQTIVDILNGKPYTTPPPPVRLLSSPSGSVNGASASVAIGGARPKTTPYMPSTSSKHSLGVPSATRGRSSSAASMECGETASDSGIVWTARARRRPSSRSSSGSPEPLPAFIQDDLATLDYVTRIRLSKQLDENGQWEELARALHCEHMIDNLKVCCMADNSSPTVLLLDQLELTPGSSITGLLNALRERGHRASVDMIIRKLKQQNNEKHSGASNCDNAEAAS